MGKGSESTTVQNNYRPLTSDELRMQKSSADYAEAIQPSAYNLFQRSMGMLGAPGTDTTVNPNYNYLYGNQSAATAANAQTQANIAKGILPQSFTDNRNAQAQSYAQKSVGGLLSNLANRGVIGSSQFDSGMKGINDSLAETFNNSYTNDLNTVGNLVNRSQDYANMPIQQANQAQTASYQMPLQLFGAATGQMQPTQQMWQPTLLSNQSNPISSTQTTSGGGSGLFGGLLGIAGNALGTSWGRRW